ncbi:hypothetical protein ACLOJK_006295 [Asimina triloba]
MEEMMMMGEGGDESVVRPTTTNAASLTTSSPSSSSSSSWKFYQNPCFQSNRDLQHRHHHPVFSARKLAASLHHYLSTFPYHHRRSMTSFPPSKPSDLDSARAQIAGLTAQVEFERSLRRKAESLNKRLAREALEERKKREATERACEELADEIAGMREEMERVKSEMEEERKMLRIAEVWREERVQMKLSEARMFMEEKMMEWSRGKKVGKGEEGKAGGEGNSAISDVDGGICQGEEKAGEGSSDGGGGNWVRAASQGKRSSPEPENPHIRRGIKGFVEFPRVVRAVGSKAGRQLGSKLECQKAQLRLFLRHKSPVGLSVASPDNVRLVLG